MGMKLKSVPFQLEGRTYDLRVNMAVLADVQEAYGGNFNLALNDATRGSMEIFAAMLNDSADEKGYPERFTGKTVSRKLSINQGIKAMDIVRELVTASMADPGEKPSEEDEKNE